MIKLPKGRFILRIVFMGTPEFAVPPLKQLFLDQHKVVAVYTQPDREAGRGRSLVASPVKRMAIELGIPVIQPVNFKKAETIKQLSSFQPDVIVVAAFGQLLPRSVLDIPAGGCINIHPSLLPKYRGTSPVAASILAGDDFTGVSIMLLDIGMDTGPVLSQAQTAISFRDTSGSLTAKLSLVAAYLLVETLPRWTGGELTPRPQDSTEASYTKMLTKQEGLMDWALPAVDIWRRIRALQPWPGCYTMWQGKQLKIIEAVPLPAEKKMKAGQVVEINREEAGFGVGTGEGVLGVLKVQLEGKRAMPAAEFLRGRKQLVGVILPSN